MELNISLTAALDYKEWLLHKIREDDDGKFSEYVRDVQEAVLLGMWFREWNASYCLPYSLTYMVRHVEEKLVPFRDQMVFFGNKFQEDTKGQAELYQYCVYMLDNMMLDEGDMILLAVYLGKQIGTALDIGIEKNLEGNVVFVKTRSKSAFVGVVKAHHREDIILVNAHELFMNNMRSLYKLIDSGDIGKLCPKVFLYDVCELIPCTMEMLYNFVQRTGCQTYGCPPLVSSEEVQSENQNQ